MDSVYKIIEIVGTSESSWEDAAKTALDTAAKTIDDIRIAEVSKLDIKMSTDGNIFFRTKLKVSFKYRS
ncbi:MAG TPA: dodecin family protein [Atribacterota bacterium]|nr:dodecin family protein [Atribacterota bacterium]